MKEKMIELVKEIGRILLICLFALLIIFLVSLVLTLFLSESLLNVCWRLYAGIGGLVFLMAAILLLMNKPGGRKKMRFWQQYLPHVSFTAAILLLGVVLVLCAGILNSISVL